MVIAPIWPGDASAELSEAAWAWAPVLRLMLHPVKVKAPVTTLVGFAAQASAAPAGVVMLRVIDAVLSQQWTTKQTPPQLRRRPVRPFARCDHLHAMPIPDSDSLQRLHLPVPPFRMSVSRPLTRRLAPEPTPRRRAIPTGSNQPGRAFDVPFG